MKVGTKGQIVIPKEFREAIRLKEGGKAIVQLLKDSVVILPKPKDPVDFLIKVARENVIGNVRKEVKSERMVE